MHVISASRRTDIPAFHARWFMNRVAAGYATVVSPFGAKVHEVSLAAADVIAVVFWTKNAGPIVPHLEELTQRGHCFTFLYTINNYPSSIEPGVPKLSRTLEIVETLAKRFPSSKMRWRYDTIVLTETLNASWHLRNFGQLCRTLAPYTSECIFSFCDYYRKTVRNMDRHAPDYRKPGEEESRFLAQELASVGHQWGIGLASCAHDFLVSGSITRARCIDPRFLADVVDTPARRDALDRLKPAPTRKGCDCAASRDIGAYDTCAHGCVYCYANTDAELARRNLGRVSPECECLHPWGEKISGVVK